MSTRTGTTKLRRQSLSQAANAAARIKRPGASDRAIKNAGAAPRGLYQKLSTGASQEDLIYKSTDGAFVFPGDWSPEGKFIVFRKLLPGTTGALWTLSIDGDRQVKALPQADVRGVNGRFSPDGRWLAYQSSETGRFEVFVQPFPPTGATGWRRPAAVAP